MRQRCAPRKGAVFHPLADTMSATLLQLCPAGDVPEGGSLKVERDGLILAVFNLGGRYFVTDDACTHGPGSLSEGEIDGEIVLGAVNRKRTASSIH